MKTGLLPIELGKMLNQTLEKRQIGDYDVDAIVSEEDALKVLPDSALFLKKVKTYLGS